MQAGFRLRDGQQRFNPILLYCNKLAPIIVKTRSSTRRYKKVGRMARECLMDCIQKGLSIVSTQVSRQFNINYSTAKSIVQNYRKQRSIHNTSDSEGKLKDEPLDAPQHKMEGCELSPLAL